VPFLVLLNVFFAETYRGVYTHQRGSQRYLTFLYKGGYRLFQALENTLDVAEVELKVVCSHSAVFRFFCDLLKRFLWNSCFSGKR
jgi:hypothetical protein